MKYEFKAHPLMILSLLRPFVFILVIPVIKIVIQVLISGKVTGFLLWELFSLAVLTAIGVIRWKAYSVLIEGDKITIKQGFLFRRSSTVAISSISSVETTRNPVDRIFGSVTYEINTEAGVLRRSDFHFKIAFADSHRLSSLLYKQKREKTTVKFSLLKLAIMAATTSSVLTGIIVSVPIIKKTGDLLGLAIGEMLLDRINDTADKVQIYFPPIVNTITIIFIIAYFIAFCYSLLKYMRFCLQVDDKKVSVSSGFFVRRKTVFKKKAINDIKIEQTPLMRLFGLYSLNVGVGGFGDSRKETATVVPCGKKDKIEEYTAAFFPFISKDGKKIIPDKTSLNRNRFLFKPLVFSGIVIGVVVAMVMIFAYFDRLMLFLMFVSLAIILYYAGLCIYNYNYSELIIGKASVTARGIIGFGSRELRCPKEKIGEIKIIRYPADIRHNTCKVKLTVRSESADRLRLLHLDYNKVKKAIFEGFLAE